MKIKGLSSNSDEYFVVIANDRVHHDAVERMLDRNYNYARMMHSMKSLCIRVRAERKVTHNARPNRIGIFLHMAANMDRLQDVHDDIIRYAREHCYLLGALNVPRVGDEVNMKINVPKRQEKAMKFSTVHYINDKDIEQHTDEDLVGLIQQEQNRVSSLKALDVKSTNLNEKLQTHHKNIERLVSILDSRVK